MPSLRSRVIRLAASMPKRSSERKALLDVLARSTRNWIGTIIDYLPALDIDRRALARMSADDLEWMADTLIADEDKLHAGAVRGHRQILRMLYDAGVTDSPGR